MRIFSDSGNEFLLTFGNALTRLRASSLLTISREGRSILIWSSEIHLIL